MATKIKSKDGAQNQHDVPKLVGGRSYVRHWVGCEQAVFGRPSHGEVDSG
jgi:hypothetical protein